MKSSLIVASVSTIWLGAASAAPVAYEINKDHTDVTFTISHAGLSMKHGSFADVSGTLQLDAEQLETSSVDVTIAAKSIYTGHAKRDQDLQGAKYLDVAQFPTMHFASTKVATVSPTNLDVTGNLTLHGVTKELVLHAKINLIGKSPFGGVQAAGFTAAGVLKRSDFGIKTFLPLIGDDVTITIDTEFAVPQQQ